MKALLAALVLVVAAATSADADPVKCTRAINKEVSKYIKTVQKNVDKCKNKFITKGENGALANCTVAAIKAWYQDAMAEDRVAAITPAVTRIPYRATFFMAAIRPTAKSSRWKRLAPFQLPV